MDAGLPGRSGSVRTSFEYHRKLHTFMKKLLLAIPLVAGGSWAGASYYSGTQTQSAYEDLLVQVNELNPFTLENESYTSGLTESLAITQVKESAAADAKVLFRLQHVINHSPISLDDGGVRVGAASVTSTLVEDGSLPDSVKEFMAGFAEGEPLVVVTDVGFDGNTDTHFHVSPYGAEKDGVELNFGGIDYSLNVSDDGDVVVGSGELGAFEVSGVEADLMLTPGKIITDMTRAAKGIYSGTNGIDFDTFTISSDTNAVINTTLKSLSLHSVTDVDEDQLSGKTVMSIGQVDNPMVPVNAASVETTMSNLSIEGIQGYIDTISEMAIEELVLAEDPAVIKRILQAYLPIIGPGTGVGFNLNLSNDGGDANLSYDLAVLDETAPAYPAQGLKSLVTLRDLLNVLAFEVHFNADAEAIDQTPLAMFMMSPQAQQVIVADGVTYKGDVSLNELVLDINGNPLAIEMMLGEKLDVPLTEMFSL